MHVLISMIINTKWRQSRTTKDSSSHQRYTHHKEKCICCIWIMKSLQIIFFSVIKRDVLISNLTQVQRYPAALQTLDGSASQWYQYVYIFFCCRAHDIIVAEQKNISMFMWCIEVLQSHTRFISFRLLFLFFHSHNQDFAGV